MQQNPGLHFSRRSFLSAASLAACSSVLPCFRAFAEELDSRTAKLVASTFGIDTHNHIDVPMTADELPGPDLDIRGELKRSGLAAICMTFATDYQRGDPYQRFLTAMQAFDQQLQRHSLRRSLTAADVEAAHRAGQPAVVQAIEGGHFLEGKLERVQEAYGRGLRHFGLLHDSDASVPLGDVYTSPPTLGGLTAFGAAVVKECNRLGMLVDLAHADARTTAMALKISTRPVIVSHTGLDTQLGGNPRMAQMMRPRLIGREQAKSIADAGGVIGVWTHLADTPLQYAKNIRALVDVIGIDHVCIGTDTKLTPPTPRRGGPPFDGPAQHGPGPQPTSGASSIGPQQTGPGPEPRGPERPRVGERTNEAWEGQTAGFYYVVVNALLKTGFSAGEIAKIGGGNYLRIFRQATGR